MLRDVSTETVSMRRARRELAEMREIAAQQGLGLDHETVELYEHLSACPDCILRVNNDPAFCEVADAILDGPDDDDEAAAEQQRRQG